ncbi:MAG: apolipoprotein N-acyltransferase [Phycisphaerales bacterium]|nr:apolipoprotein N-acyltransferase [Phycisphaerales bacterium]
MSSQGRQATASQGGGKGRRTRNARRDRGASSQTDRRGTLVAGLGAIQSKKAILLLTLASLGMTILIFPRLNLWPIAYICLVPWLLCVCRGGSSRFLYFISYLFGVAYFAINVYWLEPVTMEGYIAFCLFFGIFMPLAAWPIRHLYNRRGVSAAIAAPIVWTGIEFLRSSGPLGFPMVLLGHSQYKLQSVIQIADLVGAYGVTFMVVAVNGWFVDLLMQPIVMRRGGRVPRMPLGTVTTSAIVILTLIYGSAQKNERHMAEGPRIAVVQHDILQQLGVQPNRRFDGPETYLAHLRLAQQAAALEPTPDLIVMPESIIPYCYANEEFETYDRDTLEFIRQRRFAGAPASVMPQVQSFAMQVRKGFQQVCDDAHVSLILGAGGIVSYKSAIPPHVRAYNSSYLLVPGETKPRAMYSKRHLVMISEYVPFRWTWPRAYQWINSLAPFGEGSHYTMTPGEAFVPFLVETRDSKKIYRVGTPICYEEIMPYVPRGFVRGPDNTPAGKSIDVLCCMSNDGWFHHSTELEEHLAAGVFRAVENRVAVARSVNTGESAIIYPNGKIHTRVRLTDEQIKQLDNVEAVLHDLTSIAEKLNAGNLPAQKLRATRDEVVKTVESRLSAAYSAIGPEYFIYADRILTITGSISDLAPGILKQTVATLLDQLNDDIAMVRRWRERPTTAPGVVSARIRIDPRITLYTRWGDWFAAIMLVASGLGVLDWLRYRVVRRRQSPAMEGTAHASN